MSEKTGPLAEGGQEIRCLLEWWEIRLTFWPITEPLSDKVVNPGSGKRFPCAWLPPLWQQAAVRGLLLKHFQAAEKYINLDASPFAAIEMFVFTIRKLMMKLIQVLK
ncbi:hypothetical protein [Alteribacillus sp. HJP-4]|uniref:hypothetical protein n=1 Tax=Alteribacillus sp. HJP-4 TaxID=2775394 RepID=UPI0035CD26F1